MPSSIHCPRQVSTTKLKNKLNKAGATVQPCLSPLDTLFSPCMSCPLILSSADISSVLFAWSKLVGSLTNPNESSRALFPGGGSHGRKGLAASLQSYICTPKEQPTNASGVDGDACSVQIERHETEGAHKCSNWCHCQVLPFYIYSWEKRL